MRHGHGRRATEDTGEDTGSDEPFGYRDDATLDTLWDSCAGGDMAACDELYFSAPIDSEYESFGDTCGNTAEGGAACASSTTTGEPYNYGDDATLDALWDSCAAGDMAACRLAVRDVAGGLDLRDLRGHLRRPAGGRHHPVVRPEPMSGVGHAADGVSRRCTTRRPRGSVLRVRTPWVVGCSLVAATRRPRPDPRRGGLCWPEP